MALDSKLRGCDVVVLRIEGVAPHGNALDRATVRQRKTGRPVRFELTEQTCEAVDTYPREKERRQTEFLFPGHGKRDTHLTTREYARLLGEWVACIDLDPSLFGTLSLRRTKATHIYRRTGNLRVVQVLLGHAKVESAVRYLGIEVDDALAISH